MKNLFTLVSIILLFLILPYCKTAGDDIDIRGEWSFIAAYGQLYQAGPIVFKGGSESAGTLIQEGGSGTWTVNDKQINFSITYVETAIGESLFTFTGTIRDENFMSGTFTVVYLDVDNRTFGGDWEANR